MFEKLEDIFFDELGVVMQVIFDGNLGKQFFFLIVRMILLKMLGGFNIIVVCKYFEICWGFGMGCQDGIFLFVLIMEFVVRLGLEGDVKVFLDDVVQKYVFNVGISFFIVVVVGLVGGVGVGMMMDFVVIDVFIKDQWMFFKQQFELFVCYFKMDFCGGDKVFINLQKFEKVF